MAKIDILLPYWGDVNLYKKTVQSVLAQTEKDWHLIVLDDHYPTLDAQKYTYSLHDPRITYVRHDKNIGITKNFNFAIQQAKASVCSILGCDDILLPEYVKTALQNIGDSDFYQPGVQVIDETGTPYLPLADRMKKILRFNLSGVYGGQKLAASLCTGNWLYFPSIVWKTQALRQYSFNPTYKIAEDLALELQMILDGRTMQLDNTTTFQYRRFAQSLSSIEKKKGGVRFIEEDAVYADFAKKFKARRWLLAAIAARIRITSRLHQLISR